MAIFPGENKEIECYAIIITHNPSAADLATLLISTTSQVDSIFSIDNASKNPVLLPNSLHNIEQICLPNNIGIAAAQNIGIELAKSRSGTHVIFMDQDSTPAPNMVSKLFEACNALQAKGYSVSAIGPTHTDPVTKNSASFMQLGNFTFRQINKPDMSGYIPADLLISSGSLISINVLDDVGPMDESLFIDRVDTEWFLRARAKGYRALGVPDAIMHHSLGENTRKVWFGRWRHVPQHKPFRHYYMFRNSLLLYKRDYIPFKWKINDLIKLIYLFVFCLACMPERRKRLLMIVRGISDGLRGISGKLECTGE